MLSCGYFLSPAQVGIITGATYLIAAYALPAWVMLRLMPKRIHRLERGLLTVLIPAAILLSMAGLFASVLRLVEELELGVGAGWGASPGAPHLGIALMRLVGLSTR